MDVQREKAGERSLDMKIETYPAGYGSSGVYGTEANITFASIKANISYSSENRWKNQKHYNWHKIKNFK